MDQSFDPGRTPFAGSGLVLQPDGKVLVGTHATLISGTNRFAAERRIPNGSRDNAFFGLDLRWHQKLFVPDYVVSFNAPIAQPDGKILVGGRADRQECDVEGGCYLVGTDFLARMNPDGTRDVTFNPPDTNAYASAIALQPDGKVVAAGRIQISGVDRAVVRLLASGVADNTFTPVPFNAFDVDVLVIQPDGKVLMGGSFSTVLGQSRRGVARLNSNGSLDNTFTPGTGVGGSVRTMALQPDGKVLIGGSFTNINGTARTNLARLHSDGTVDMTFNAWTDADKLVRAIALQPDGNILITGNFITVDGTLRPHIARLLGDSPFPTLGVARTNSLVKISWPVSVLNLQLQESTDLALANGWSAVGATRSTNDSFISVTLPVTSNEKFFRLRLP